MIKKFSLYVVFLAMALNLFSLNGSAQSNCQFYYNENINMETKSIALKKVARDYLKFVHDVGSAQSVQADDIRIKTLFAENLSKFDNRSILFENNRDLLLPQMKGFEKEHNSGSSEADWIVEIDKALIISSLEANSVVIYFEWIHINIGRNTTIAILQCNNNNQIERIIDVWAKV